MATALAVISSETTIHRPSAALASTRWPKARGGIDQAAPSATPSSTVSRTSPSVAVTAVRWRLARRRKATAVPAAATIAPQLASCQSGTSGARRIVTSEAPITLAASMNSASWLPACSWAARIGPQSVVSAGSYRPKSARASMRGRANCEVVWLFTRRV